MYYHTDILYEMSYIIAELIKMKMMIVRMMMSHHRQNCTYSWFIFFISELLKLLYSCYNLL